MRRVHKESTCHFLVGELRLASASRLVDDQTAETVGILAAAMSSMYDSTSRNFLTCDGGATFHAVSYNLTPNGIAMLVNENLETNAERIASLQLALEKWAEAA
jgi:hypothetical protein